MRKFFSWCRRYVSIINLLVIGFTVYMIFFQSNSIFRYMEYSNTIDSLKVEIKNYTDTMLFYQQQNALLSQDPEMMERVVREQYHMNRENEDIYVFH